MNAYLNGTFIFEIFPRPQQWFNDLRFIIGTLIFVTGFIIYKRSDQILTSIRKDNKGYQIPQKGLFRYVSNPHYLGEIIEWSGWAILTWSTAGLAFAVFTFANLVPRAISHQRWYQTIFPEYPGKRKILIPFIW